ncbi:MAG: hypothetical protein Q9190_004679 [Brigantiaea leucoxantha]
MPGRQSTAPRPVLGPPKSSKKHKQSKRTLNALAIAETQDPSRAKIRRHRLGEVEQDGNVKRKREVAQQNRDFKDEDGNMGGGKRRRVGGSKYGPNEDVELGSDSDGNEWMVGNVNSEDNESLDSDEALGESDEERFEGFVFRGSSSHHKAKKLPEKSSKKKKLVEEAMPNNFDFREGESEQSDFGDEGVDLATILDQEVEKDDKGDAIGNRARNEEDDDFAEFDSKDEALTEESEDEESVLSVSEDERGLANTEKIASLQSLASAMNQQDQPQTAMQRIPDIHESRTPSEFNITSKQKLTFADLDLGHLTNAYTKSSSKRNGIAQKLEVPLPKREQDHLDRVAAYNRSKDTLKRWVDTVKDRRRAEHLSFPLHDPEQQSALTSNKIQRSLRPLTGLETEIQNVLEESGLAPAHGRPEEDQSQAIEGLQTNKLSLKEIEARRAELRRMRDLLFREERRSKRIKKIKSKAFRRVHRKERERHARLDRDALLAAGLEESESEKERNDRRRAEERMGARHRESRWARGVKDSGRAAWDADARGGVIEMARRNEELRKRMMGKDVDRSDSGTDSSAEEDEADETKAIEKTRNRLSRLGDDDHELLAGVGSSTSALSSMKFMQNADAARKKMNDEAVEQLQKDLAGEETPDVENETEIAGRRLYGPTKNTVQDSKPVASAAKDEFEENITSDGNDDRNEANVEEDETEIIVNKIPTDFTHVSRKGSISAQKHATDQTSSTRPLIDEMENNPWLSGGIKKSSSRDRRVQDSRAPPIVSNELPSQVSVNLPRDNRPPLGHNASSKTEGSQENAPGIDVQRHHQALNEDSGNEEEKLPLVLQNHDLVRRAFAGDEVVADFKKEKQELMEDEDDKVVDNTLPGWGNWTGAGISKKQQQRNKGRILIKQKGIPKEKRQDAKLDKVIINEKQVKKNAKYLASSLPHPFETRQQYERSLRLPIGPEWTTKETFQAATKPRILMKQGVITPMAKPII